MFKADPQQVVYFKEQDAVAQRIILNTLQDNVNSLIMDCNFAREMYLLLEKCLQARHKVKPCFCTKSSIALKGMKGTLWTLI